MVLLNAAEQDCHSETRGLPGSVCLTEQNRTRPESSLPLLWRRHLYPRWLSPDPKPSLEMALRWVDFGLRQEPPRAQIHPWSCWIPQFAQARTLPKSNSARGECPFHSGCPFHNQFPAHIQFPRNSQWHLVECPSHNLREDLRRQLRRSHLRELRCELHRNRSCDLYHRRARVLRLRVPVHQWLEGCRQAPHLQRP